MNKTSRLEPTLVGVAGEYFVAAELSARGIIASITLRNSRGIDIVASNADASRTISIQVKTNTNGTAVWLMNKKAENFESPKHFYVFVILKQLGIRPDFYVVPSRIVSEYARQHHAEWISGTKRDGTARQDNSMRKFRDKEGEYLESWGLLKL